MNNKEKLKLALAEMLGINKNEITDFYSLDIPKFKSSAGSIILSNVVKKVYGQKVDCSKIKTFMELVAKAEGLNDIQDTKTDSKAISAQPVTAIYEPASVNTTGMLKCGIDIQDIAIFPKSDDYWSEQFYKDNFTNEEIAYCVSTSHPRQSFAARWCLKEALHKCGPEFYSLPLLNIQIKKLPDGSVCLEICLSGEWQRVSCSCSISHSESYAVGMVILLVPLITFFKEQTINSIPNPITKLTETQPIKKRWWNWKKY